MQTSYRYLWRSYTSLAKYMAMVDDILYLNVQHLPSQELRDGAFNVFVNMFIGI